MNTSELKMMTVKELKDLAAEKTDAEGITSMKKDELVDLLSDGEESPSPVKKSSVKKSSKTPPKLTKEIAKSEIKRLKNKQAEISSGSPNSKNIQRRVRNLKRFIRSA